MEGWKKEKEEERRRVTSRSTEINLCLKKIVRMLRNSMLEWLQITNLAS